MLKLIKFQINVKFCTKIKYIKPSPLCYKKLRVCAETMIFEETVLCTEYKS